MIQLEGFPQTLGIEIRENKGFFIMVILRILGSLVACNQLEFYNSELYPKPNFSFQF